jgi:hypothetical protein
MRVKTALMETPAKKIPVSFDYVIEADLRTESEISDLLIGSETSKSV